MLRYRAHAPCRFNALHRHFPSDPRWNRFLFHLVFVERYEVYHNDSVVSIAMIPPLRLEQMVDPPGLEPGTGCLWDFDSDRLSYWSEMKQGYDSGLYRLLCPDRLHF